MANTEQLNDGGPAFPTPDTIFINANGDAQTQFGNPGMSLRDWFAGQALPQVLKWWTKDPETGKPDKDFILDDDADCIARQAYCLADAMLEHRKI